MTKRFKISRAPEWANPRWVKALYSPLVAETIDQMSAEHERRRKALAAPGAIKTIAVLLIAQILLPGMASGAHFRKHKNCA